MKNLRVWISTITSATACGGFAFAQTPPSGAPAALSAQTAALHPAIDKPMFTLRTAGQRDRVVRRLKMTDSSGGVSVAEVQGMLTARAFTMPAEVVRVILVGSRPELPSPA